MDKIKILCLVVLGFCLGFFSGKAHGFDENGEAFCLAQNIYFEAGNQPLAGKLAVAHVAVSYTHLTLPTICSV